MVNRSLLLVQNEKNMQHILRPITENAFTVKKICFFGRNVPVFMGIV